MLYQHLWHFISHIPLKKIDLVIQLAKNRRSQHQEVSIDWTRQVIKDITNGRVPKASKAYISRFWKKVGWPSHRTQARNKKEVRESLEEEMEQFRNEVKKKERVSRPPGHFVPLQALTLIQIEFQFLIQF